MGKQDPRLALERLSDGVRGMLAVQLDPTRRQYASALGAPPSLDVLRLTLAGAAAFWRAPAEARPLLTRAIALDSTFAVARILLAIAEWNLGKSALADSLARVVESGGFRISRFDQGLLTWIRAELDGDRQAAYRAMEEGCCLMPSDGGFQQLGYEFQKLNRPPQSLATLAKVNPASAELEGVSQTGGLQTIAADGSSVPVRIPGIAAYAFEPRWTADGSRILFAVRSGGRGLTDIWTIRPGLDTVASPLVATEMSEQSPSASPDGRWLLFRGDRGTAATAATFVWPL